MHPRESISGFIRKFRKAVKAVHDVSIGHKPQDPVEIAELFIRKCLRAADKGSDKRNCLLFYQRVLSHRKPSDPLPFTLSKLEFDLCQCELNKNNNKESSRSSSKFRHNKYKHYQKHSKTFLKTTKMSQMWRTTQVN